MLAKGETGLLLLEGDSYPIRRYRGDDNHVARGLTREHGLGLPLTCQRPLTDDVLLLRRRV